jgi:hypothetical protein
MGQRCSDTRAITFEDVEVPVEVLHDIFLFLLRCRCENSAVKYACVLVLAKIFTIEKIVLIFYHF